MLFVDPIVEESRVAPQPISLVSDESCPFLPLLSVEVRVVDNWVLGNPLNDFFFLLID